MPIRLTGEVNPDHVTAMLRGGAVCLLPTDTVYGLHAALDRPDAVTAIRRMKGADPDRPFIVLARRFDLPRLGIVLPDCAMEALENIWPGPVTIVFSTVRNDLFPDGSVAVRSPDHPLWRSLFDAGCHPVVSTSANASGREPAGSPADVAPDILRQVDLVVDAGLCASRDPSRIVDIRPSEPLILRGERVGFPQKVWKNLRKIAARQS